MGVESSAGDLLTLSKFIVMSGVTGPTRPALSGIRTGVSGLGGERANKVVKTAACSVRS